MIRIGTGSAWWGDRIDPNWQPRTQAQNQAILNDLGLTDAFWNLSAEWVAGR